jgi:hypothetical protein
VLSILLVLLLVWLGLMVLLWAGSLWLQDFIYSEPAEGLFWRAPAAGSVLALFVVLCCQIDSHSPVRYFSPIEFSASETQGPFPELWAVKGGKKIHYTLTKDERGRAEYYDSQRKPLPTHADEIIIKDDGEEVVFKPERDEQGNYLFRRGKSLRYVDDRGREMWEDRVGQLSTFRWGRFLACAFLNLFHLGLWFLVLWLLLRFQWSHALGLSLILWLAMTILMATFVFPTVQDHLKSTRVASRGVDLQNPKSEVRNSKQTQITKEENPKQEARYAQF